MRRKRVACAVFASAITCGVAPGQPMEVEAVLSRLREAYTVDRPYEQHMAMQRITGLGEGVDPSRLTPTRLGSLADEGRNVLTAMVTCHPEWGVIVDRTNPLVRRAHGRRAFLIFGPDDATHDFQPGGPYPTRFVSDRASVLAGPREYSPAAWGWDASLTAQRDPEGTTVEHDAEGRVVLRVERSKHTFWIDPSDWTIVRTKIEGIAEAPLTEWYSGLEQTGAMKARSPRYRLRLVDWDPRSGRKPFWSVTVFDRPVLDPDVDREAFRWQSYAKYAVSRDDLVYGHNETVVGTKEEVFGKATKKPKGQQIELDRDAMRRAATDPSFMMMPRRGLPFNPWLMAAGVTLLVLAGGWLVRRRLP